MPSKAPVKKKTGSPAAKPAAGVRHARAPKKAEAAESKPKDPVKPKPKVVSLIDEPEKVSPVPPSEPEPAAVVVEKEAVPEQTEDGRKIINIKPPIVVKDLAAAMGIKPFVVIKGLMEVNIFVTLNQTIDPSVAAQICEKHGFVFEKEKRQAGAGVHKAEPVVAPPSEPEAVTTLSTGVRPDAALSIPATT